MHSLSLVVDSRHMKLQLLFVDGVDYLILKIEECIVTKVLDRMLINDKK